MTLAEIIAQRIRSNGPISFSEFMEMALYFPEKGYYTSPRKKIGARGDYFTSSSLGPLFGSLIARQLEEMWILLGKEEFSVVEFGAGTGWMALDILNYLQQHSPLYDHLHYHIVEKSMQMQKYERDILGTHANVSWHRSISDIHHIKGCILLNEVFDNFPVHRVIMQEELKEIFVDHDDNFTESLKPASEELKSYLKELDVDLQEGIQTEINLEAIPWLENTGRYLQQGFTLIIDYGDRSNKIYRKKNRTGNLLCYSGHSINDNPYHRIGEQDITTRVNFSALEHWGNKCGLETCGLTDQANFLAGLGFKECLQTLAGTDKDPSQLALEACRLSRILLLEMGPKIKVLIQRKGVGPSKLAGMQFPYAPETHEQLLLSP